MKDRFFRYWTYLKHGHSAWLMFLLSFVNFVVIQYKLVIESIPALSFLFPQLIIFVAFFAVVYIPLATVIGWRDYKKGAFPVGSSVAALANPWSRDMAKALILMCDGKPKEAKRVLEKWCQQ